MPNLIIDGSRCFLLLIIDIFQASCFDLSYDSIHKLAIEPIEGNASPLKPRDAIRIRSPSLIFDVACLSKHIFKSSRVIPLPLSTTSIKAFLPSDKYMDISVDPASIEFSINSFRAELGLSITSPAAI